MKGSKNTIKQYTPNGSMIPLSLSILPFLSIKQLLLGFLSSSAIVYILFQKKLLPKSISKIVSKIFFFPTFPITALMRINNYWTIIDDTLILGCAPMAFLGHPKKLYNLGVRNVINMQTEYDGPTSSYNEIGITQLRLPTVDHFEPSLEYINQAIKFISQKKERGEKVYVHCKAGHGRAASIALCWMIHENFGKLEPKELNTILSEKRKVRKTLYKQSNIVKYYQQLLNEKKTGN